MDGVIRTKIFKGGALLAAVALTAMFSTWLVAAEPRGQRYASEAGRLDSLPNLSATDCYALDLFEERAAQGLEKGGRFPASLGWTTSGVWHDGRLLLADTTHQRVVTADMTGRVDALDLWTAKAGTRQEPSFVSPRLEGGYIVSYFLTKEGEMGSRNRIFFADANGELEDRSLEPRGRIFYDAARGQTMVSRGFFQAVAMDQGVFMVGGATKFEPKSPYSGLFAYVDNEVFHPYESPVEDEKLQELTTKYFARDLRLMAVVEDGDESAAYVLFLEEEPARPWIGRARRSSTEIEPLESFPAGWTVPRTRIKNRSTTPINEFVADIEKHYRAIEQSAMPVGLYSWRNRLFVMTKSAANPSNGRTAWHLIEVDTDDGSAVGKPTPLPSQSEHLLLVPAAAPDNSYFAIIEKGAVDAIRNLRIHYLYRPGNSAVLFPESWIDTETPVGMRPKSTRACQPVPIS